MDLKIGGQVVPVSDTFKQLSREEQAEVIERIIADKGIKPAEPETTVDDVGTGIKSGITTGAVAAAPGLGALITDIAEAPIHLGYNLADAAAGLAGYDTGLAKAHKPGGYFQRTGWVGEKAREQADRWVEPPKTPGGKITREVTSAGIEALAGSGLFKFMGRIFNSYDDAVRAAEAVQANPALAHTVQAGIREAGAAPVAQAAYSAAAGGGGEIAQQNDVNPLLGSGLGVLAAATGHVAATKGPAAVKAGVEKTVLPASAHERLAADKLATVSKDPVALEAWRQRAQQAEDAFQRATAEGADEATLRGLDQARREAHGELVQGSEPSLYEATDIRGVGHAQRNAFTEGTGEYPSGIEQRREAQNEARVEELRRLGGEGTPDELLAEFRRVRDKIDAQTLKAEREAQEGAAETASTAVTLSTPEAVGTAIRTPVVAQLEEAKRVGNELYANIGAQGVTVGTGRLKAAIAKAWQDIRENPLAPREREIVDIVTKYGGRVDYNTLEELRKDVISRAANMNLSKTERWRAGELQRAIDEAQDSGLQKALADDPNLFRRVVDGLEADALPIDEAITARQREARRHWKENVKQPFELEPVAGVVERAPLSASGFEMTPGGVAEASFVSGNKGAEGIRALKAAGATDAALTEAAALSFSDPKRGVIRDGVVDPKGFRRWLNNYGPALAELPDSVRQRFQSANDAAMTLELVSADRAARLERFNRSAAGEVLGIPVENLRRDIRTFLENRARMNELAARVKDTPAAKAGLQKIVADHILERFTNGTDELSKASLSTYVKRHEAQLTAVFGRDGLDRFKRVAADIERSRKLQNIGKDPAGPSTAADIARAGLDTSIMTVAAGIGGAPGVAAAASAKFLHRLLRQSGVNNINELYARALLEPEFARKILTKASALKNEKFRKGLGTTILRSSLAGLAYGGNQ
jgi:hypothetical protein